MKDGSHRRGGSPLRRRASEGSLDPDWSKYGNHCNLFHQAVPPDPPSRPDRRPEAAQMNHFIKIKVLGGAMKAARV